MLEVVRAAAQMATGFGLGVNAGHGLNYFNIKPITTIREIQEVSIGHAVISQAVFVGLEGAIKQMRKLMGFTVP